ncbi:RraA family protein [Mycobacterium sp. CBMA293]|uniref:RraA family protein n=1 Tax=unclassified Mycolicibacterium TaxID=2636767 RepID=UPI0012DD2711|nr:MULTISPECIES: RraA family protein [unclassified Mycolicibacterium]MUL49383.1 RraA family protein [Mycolicibacterium sp. CBMA 360]MUL62559.1 RraA family protein [Mycolicibacterium sp. CBMA 335]MUL69011.1 RraA family protein [Mycolicibacterium sp. CBMA 311]MUL96950.1 RraA family protein [Mycolicibacterium sp. CBMA 230]MUM04012.1 hypothetical protein [Mycolicibacterium sp. CBMA 213]
MQNGPLGFCAVARPITLKREEYEPLLAYRSCDISDAMNMSHTMLGLVAAYHPIPRIAGPAITVSVPGSGFDIITAAMALAEPGDILVISTQGSLNAAYWGGYMTGVARERGIAGVIVDGAIRDADEIEEQEFPAYSRSRATRVAVTEGPWGEINMPIACGGISVSAGDIVVADEHGIVTIPSAWVERAIFDTEQFVTNDEPYADPAAHRRRLVREGLLELGSEAG